MGHAAKAWDTRCDVLDAIEAAITLRHRIRVVFEDGSTRAGMPIDLVTQDHQDLLQLQGHLPIPVTQITTVEKI